MSNFCKETYKKTLEEILSFIKSGPPKSVEDIERTIEYSIKTLDDEHRELTIKDGKVTEIK